MTKVNNPKVKISRGSATNMRMGRNTALRIPSNSDATIKSNGFW